LRILLAEDNVINQKVALRLLGKIGYRADVAANGLEVLEALTRQGYDVVLMDIHMPEMDGLEATQLIRQRWPAKQQPNIIALTADALASNREHYLAQGIDDYISKPIRMDELTRALSRCYPLTIQRRETPELVKSMEPVSPDTKTDEQPDDTIIDIALLRELCGDIGEDSLEVLTELIDIFLTDTPEQLKQLQQAIAEGDHDKTVHLAHTLKSTSATLGARNFSELCRILEIAGQEGQLEEATEKIRLLKLEYEKVKTKLASVAQDVVS
jgi:CheY-like chemotaxis protein